LRVGLRVSCGLWVVGSLGGEWGPAESPSNGLQSLYCTMCYLQSKIQNTTTYLCVSEVKNGKYAFT
jgi:hypothetical protein